MQQPRPLNVVALLAAVAALCIGLVDMWIVQGSSTQDSPWQGLLTGLLPSLAATLLVYPTVSWFTARGVSWPSALQDTRAEIERLRNEIAALREELTKEG